MKVHDRCQIEFPCSITFLESIYEWNNDATWCIRRPYVWIHVTFVRWWISLDWKVNLDKDLQKVLLNIIVLSFNLRNDTRYMSTKRDGSLFCKCTRTCWFVQFECGLVDNLLRHNLRRQNQFSRVTSSWASSSVYLNENPYRMPWFCGT